MTCYFRHINELFAELGVVVTPANKQDIDKVIHKLVGVDYKNCSAAWKTIKKQRDEDASRFMKSLDGVLQKFKE